MFKNLTNKRITATATTLSEIADVIDMERGGQVLINMPDGRTVVVSARDCDSDYDCLHDTAVAIFQIGRCDRIQQHSYCYSDGRIENSRKRVKKAA